MSTPDSRPARPEYGEYATPEEQRARIAQPDATRDLSNGQTRDGTTGARSSASTAGSSRSTIPPTGARAPVTAPASSSGARRSRPFDRVATVALLVYGLFTVLTSIPGFTDYATYANTLLEILGVQESFPATGAGRGWGLAAAFVLGLGWLLTAVLSWMSLRRGRLTWWIPLAGAAVFTIVASALLMVPLLGDPTIWNALVGMSP